LLEKDVEKNNAELLQKVEELTEKLKLNNEELKQIDIGKQSIDVLSKEVQSLRTKLEEEKSRHEKQYEIVGQKNSEIKNLKNIMDAQEKKFNEQMENATTNSALLNYDLEKNNKSKTYTRKRM